MFVYVRARWPLHQLHIIFSFVPLELQHYGDIPEYSVKMNPSLFSHIYWPLSRQRHIHSGVSLPTTHLWGLYKFLHENAPYKPQRMKRIH